ncbi:MAG TPA: hypothetical protein VHF87_09340 [Methylomirabilota bacterium]|nr:hypothetical protein [Methylomirabilota bacterium]
MADDPALCDRLAGSGCRQLLIGFESPRAADLTGLDPPGMEAAAGARLRRVIDTLQSRGVSVNGCFILGLDAQTPDVFAEILTFVRTSGLAEVQYTVLTPFPARRYTRGSVEKAGCSANGSGTGAPSST